MKHDVEVKEKALKEMAVRDLAVKVKRLLKKKRKLPRKYRSLTPKRMIESTPSRVCL